MDSSKLTGLALFALGEENQKLSDFVTLVNKGMQKTTTEND